MRLCVRFSVRRPFYSWGIPAVILAVRPTPCRLAMPDAPLEPPDCRRAACALPRSARGGGPGPSLCPPRRLSRVLPPHRSTCRRRSSAWRGSNKALPDGKRRWSARPSVARRFAHCAGGKRPGQARKKTDPGAEPVILPAPKQVGDYDILAEVGRGGMGVVYKARHRGLHRLAALKMVLAGEFASPAQEVRFRLEAELAARLHHPGIAQVYEAGLADDGQPFFAMEFIRGLPLDEYANRHGLDLAARVALVARVCDAVQHAHDQGVIHRDLKPANILVEETGQPKVLDFGVARATDADLLTAAGLTRTGQLLGTPNYMSPEQVTGDPAAIDRRADVYALGVILFELVAHRLPYRLENRPLAEAARLILEQDPPRLGSIDPELPRRRGDDRGQGAGEGPCAALPVGGRPGGGPAALAGPRADPGAAAVGAVPPAQVRPAAQGPGGRGGRHRWWPWSWGSSARSSSPSARPGSAARPSRTPRQAIGEKREAHVPGVPRPAVRRGRRDLRARRGRRRAPARRGPGGPARLGVAAPAQPARRQLCGDPAARRGASASCSPAAPDRLRVGTLTGDGLRLTDLEGGETIDGADRLPRACRRSMPRRRPAVGLRVVAWVGEHDLRPAGRGRPGPLSRGRAAERTAHVGRSSARTAAVWPRTSSATAGRRIAVFDATSGKQTASCNGHRGDVWALAFSPDGTRLASGRRGPDGAALGRGHRRLLVATCRGHASKVLGVAFSPDGARLVTTSADGTVRQWDVRDGPGGRAALRPPFRRRHRGRRTARTGNGSPRRAPTAPSGCGRRRAGRTSRSCTATRDA